MIVNSEKRKIIIHSAIHHFFSWSILSIFPHDFILCVNTVCIFKEKASFFFIPVDFFSKRKTRPQFPDHGSPFTFKEKYPRVSLEFKKKKTSGEKKIKTKQDRKSTLWTPVTSRSRMPSSAWKKKKNKKTKKKKKKYHKLFSKV